ncbi:hypothetical protein DFH07DRAFT_773833 [Mycena maculata]|uniref:Uncharacterized protein n=1 Tax=Mycena maculata TaxID=230809 RepID=A0AAD7J388_9AGAR|nr:hypothetical protein DFH07DRAFT_773833 [Mycena maculata]
MSERLKLRQKCKAADIPGRCKLSYIAHMFVIFDGWVATLEFQFICAIPLLSDREAPHLIQDVWAIYGTYIWAIYYGKYTVQKDFTSSRDGCNDNFAFGTQILDNLTKLQLQNCSNSGFQNFPMDNFAWVQLQQDATLKCNGCNFRQGHLIEETTLL